MTQDQLAELQRLLSQSGAPPLFWPGIVAYVEKLLKDKP